MKKHSLIRTIYLYIFAMLGLVLLTIGGVRFLDMGLKAFVFTKAEEEQRIYNNQLPMPIAIEKAGQAVEGEELTDEEKAQLKRVIEDYKTWQERRDKFDYVTSRRHRDASFNLALILVGLPLYLYHWRIIKKETKKQIV